LEVGGQGESQAAVENSQSRAADHKQHQW
jgi:hypothetical protein